eukprot:CFRG5213T1
MEDSSDSAEVGVMSHSVEVKTRFPSELWANIARRTLSADPEPRKGSVTKKITVDGVYLNTTLSATELRFLRTSLTGYFELLRLTVDTIREFG